MINLCSVTGILFLPCMRTGIYKLILMFMVALAVGTLLASGVLVLIPEVRKISQVLFKLFSLFVSLGKLDQKQTEDISPGGLRMFGCYIEGSNPFP